MVQFGAQASFLILIIAVSIFAGVADDNVVTAHISQAINAVWVSLAFYAGWRLMPEAPATHVLPAGKSLWTIGFTQTYHTAQSIWCHYKAGLRWFLLATVFAEAAANAFTVVSVIYLSEEVDLSGSDIAIFFLVVLVASLPGSYLGSQITKRTNPNISWRLNMLSLAVVTIVGALLVDSSRKPVAYVWGLVIGLLLGWFYSTENLFFSMCLPKGQEAELAGFFVYCTQILGWLPPLIFSLMVEAGVDQTYGVMMVAAFFFVAIAILSLAAPWEDILEEAAGMDAAIILEDSKLGEQPLELEDAKSSDDGAAVTDTVDEKLSNP